MILPRTYLASAQLQKGQVVDAIVSLIACGLLFGATNVKLVAYSCNLLNVWFLIVPLFVEDGLA
jgi:hypothetical protein